MLSLEASPDFFTEYSEITEADNFYPQFPSVKKIDDSLKAFYWSGENFNKSRNSAIYQHLLFFTDSLPDYEDFEESYKLYSFPVGEFIKPEYEFSEDYLYCQGLQRINVSDKSSRFDYYLKSFDYNENSLNQATIYYSANGETSIVPYYDSLVLVKSWIYCTDYNSLECSEWSTGYKAYIIYNNKISSIHPLLSYDTFDKSDNPTDVNRYFLNNEYQFILNNEKQLVRVNYDRMRLELVKDFFDDAPLFNERIIPIQANNLNAAVFQSSLSDSIKIITYDFDWEATDSIYVPLKGFPIEFTEISYSSIRDALFFAYSTETENQPGVSRIYLQTVGFDERSLYQYPNTITPGKFTILQNYPNPFNPMTSIEYYLPKSGKVKIDVYNILGQKIETILDQTRDAGLHRTEWDGSDYSSGIYLIKADYNNQSKTVKALLIK